MTRNEKSRLRKLDEFLELKCDWSNSRNYTLRPGVFNCTVACDGARNSKNHRVIMYKQKYYCHKYDVKFIIQKEKVENERN